MWTYKGFDIFQADHNSSGIKWVTSTQWGRLRADSKQSMKQLINRYLDSPSYHP